MENKRGFLWQGLLTTGVSLLLRAIGISAQIMIAARIGPEAVGVSALISGIGGFAVTLALSGVQPGCIRLISQALGKCQIHSARQALYCSLIHALLFGSLSGLFLFSGANYIGSSWMGDTRIVIPLRILAFTLPLVSLSSCISGYFVAVRRVYKSAFIQVTEEILRIGLTIILLNYFPMNVESALIALAISNAVADILCALLLSLLCAYDCQRLHPDCEKLKSCSNLSTFKQLLSITLPIAITAYVRSGLITWEHALIPRGLQAFGLDHSAALAAYGTIQSMALPVILLPCALLGSFAVLLVPELTEAHVRAEKQRIEFIMKRVFSLTLFFSIGTAGLMIAFSQELGYILYNNMDAAQMIRYLAPLIPIMYLDGATDAMLKGLGQQVYSMKVNIADATISVLLVAWLLPNFGIYGYIITIYVTELLNAALSILRLIHIGAMRPRIVSWIVKPIFGIIGATCLTRLIDLQFSQYFTNSFYMGRIIVLMLAVILFYIIFLVLLGSLNRQDIRWLKSFLYP